jgi:hypothetical protein
MPLILIFTLDPMPPLGTLLELEVVANHYIQQVWHILPSPSPQLFMDAGNGPPRLNPLDTMAI